MEHIVRFRVIEGCTGYPPLDPELLLEEIVPEDSSCRARAQRTQASLASTIGGRRDLA